MWSEHNNSPQTVTSVYRLTVGFTAVLLLMAMLAALGLITMDQINERIQLIVNQHNSKKALVHRMHLNARERVFALQNMILLTDPFEQDAVAMKLSTYGAGFIAARDQLLEMPLNTKERELLDRQREIAGVGAPLHRRAAALILDQRLPEARALVVNTIIPLQRESLALLEELETIQEHETEQAFTEAGLFYREARLFTIILALAASLLGAFIAYAAIRRSVMAERGLAQEKERLEVTVHSIGEGVISTTADGHIEFINPKALQLMECRRIDIVSRPLLSNFRLLPEDRDTPLEEMQELNPYLRPRHRDGRPSQGELVTSSGRTLAIEYTASPIYDRHHLLVGIVIVFRDATESRAMAEQLSHEARHDPLTNLYNRREFESRLQQAIERAHHNDSHHTLCFLDLDHFKVVNDTCGHHAGDELLKQLVSVLKQEIRSNDILARLGGDEFALLLLDCPQEKAEQIADTLRQRVRDFRFTWEGKTFHVGVSIGMVSIDRESGELSDIIAAADAACYCAKDSGRNRVHLYSAATAQTLENRKNWVEELKQALAEERFFLYCQAIEPIHPTDAGLHLCELHLRFRDQQGQQIPPHTFIPVAERHGLMPAIDRWVVRHMLEVAKEVNDPREIYFLNISGKTLLDEGFIGDLRHWLEKSPIMPGQLCFEIQEQTLLAQLEKCRPQLDELKGLGCRISVDDVGRATGTFNYLKRIDADYIKIDGQLIEALAHDSLAGLQVQTIIRLGHLLGLTVIAKQVEDRMVLEHLAHMGINYAQGYGVAKPRAVAELLAKREPLASCRAPHPALKPV